MILARNELRSICCIQHTTCIIQYTTTNILNINLVKY